MKYNYDLISVLRIHLYDCEDRPAIIIKPHIPKNAIKRAWVPQTLGDQIWVFYLFESINDRLDWEKSLPPEINRWLDRMLVPEIDFWGWNTYDAMTGIIISSDD